MRKKKLFNKLVSIFATFALLFNSYYLPLIAIIGEAKAQTSGGLQYKLEGQRTDSTWTSGNVCSGVPCYKEGDNVPFRVQIDNLSTLGSYTIEIEHDYEDTTDRLGYVEFHSPSAFSGASAITLTDLGSFPGSGGRTVRKWDLGFTATSLDVDLRWLSLLSNDASNWDGAQLHVRLNSGIEGENIGNKEVPIQVNKIIPPNSITVIKDEIPDLDTEFTFLVTGPNSYSANFSLNDDGTSSGSETIALSDLGAGQYTITETNSAFPYDTSVSCTNQVSDTDENVTFELGEGENVTCTFTNTKKSFLKVYKITDPQEEVSTEFGITLTDGAAPIGQEQVLSVGSPVTFEVEPGTYWVNETNIPGGWSANDSGCQQKEVGQGEVVECTIYNTKLGSLQGRKFYDNDGDGEWDSGENWLNGWIVRLYDSDWNPEGKMTTGDGGLLEGQYRFENLGPGTYYACEVLPEHWAQTSPSPGEQSLDGVSNPTGGVGAENQSGVVGEGPVCWQVNIEPGTDATWLLIGNYELGSIFGYKYEDANGDGIDDNDWIPVQGWEITLLQNLQQLGDPVYTNENGYYSFTDLLLGSYTVKEDTGVEGWQSASDEEQEVDVDTSGEPFGPVDFVNYQDATVSVCKVDANENPVSGWEVYVNKLVDTTEEDGCVEFTLEELGDYVVTEESREGWTPIGDTSFEFTAESGGEYGPYTFVNFNNGYISGHKYEDLDKSGNWNEGEQYLDGWVIRLSYDGEGAPNCPSPGVVDGDYCEYTTGAEGSEGHYIFGDLGPGTYTVEEILQDGWLQTEGGYEIVMTNNGAKSGNDFGNIRNPVIIKGYKVVCESEDLLPNWGNHGSTIGENTAQNWADTHEGCEAVEDWSFQWGPAGAGSFGAFQTDTSELGGSWTTFGSEALIYDTSNLGGRIETREIFPNDDYVGFSNDSGNVNDPESAEFYCTGDVYNYDNWEWINNPQYGQTYQCVGFNALNKGTITVYKNVDADGDENVDVFGSTDWKWDINGSGDYQTGSSQDVIAGQTYIVSEDQEPDYHFESLVCEAEDYEIDGETAQVYVGPGDEVSCTYTNTRDTGFLTVHKQLDTNGDGIFDDGGDTEANNLGFSWGLEENATPNDMGDSLTLLTGSFEVWESDVNNYHFTGWYPTNDEEYSCEDPYSTDYPVDGSVFSDKETEVTLCNARDTGTIYGSKWDDIDGDGQWEEENGLEGWTIELYEDIDEGGLGSLIAYRITGEEGDYIFENVPTGSYFVCEVLQGGWRQTFPLGCHPVTLEEHGDEDGNNNFGNQEYDPSVVIEKSNDKTGGASIGETVNYTLVVTNDGNQNLSNLDVIDILPGGFTYVLGSTKIDGIASPDPTNDGGKLTWNIGDLAVEDSVTIEYQATIGDTVVEGAKYTNFATCKAEVGGIFILLNGLTDQVLSRAILLDTESEVDAQECNVATSDVPIGQVLSLSTSLSPQVLGAATELPAAGSSTTLLYIFLAMIGAGYGLRTASDVLERKGKKNA